MGKRANGSIQKKSVLLAISFEIYYALSMSCDHAWRCWLIPIAQVDFEKMLVVRSCLLFGFKMFVKGYFHKLIDFCAATATPIACVEKFSNVVLSARTAEISANDGECIVNSNSCIALSCCGLQHFLKPFRSHSSTNMPCQRWDWHRLYPARIPPLHHEKGFPSFFFL